MQKNCSNKDQKETKLQAKVYFRAPLKNESKDLVEKL